LILDVLLKYFYRESYDRDCCKQSCKDCPDGKFAECEESNIKDTKQKTVLAKLFKPQGKATESGSMEVDGKSLSPEKKAEFSKELKEAVDKLEAVLNKSE
jgi:hypothetical protein